MTRPSLISKSWSATITPTMRHQICLQRWLHEIRVLRAVRTSSYLSMSRNFANGLAHARGENVIFIGDDDGLLPFGLELLNRLLDAHPDVDAVRWRPPFFWWPHAKDYAFRFPTSDFGQTRYVELASDVLPRVVHPKILNFFEMTGFTLYHGCWRRSVIDAALAEGVDLFDGPIPDVLSSIYGLRFARACLSVETPASVMGVSGKSNGWATSAAKPTEAQKLMRADFAERSRRDFPDAPPITFSYCASSPYLGSLLTYWRHLHGTLRELRPRGLARHLPQSADVSLRRRSKFAGTISIHMSLGCAPMARPAPARSRLTTFLTPSRPGNGYLINRLTHWYGFPRLGRFYGAVVVPRCR